MRRGGTLLAAAIAAAFLPGAQAAGPPGWTTYGGDPGRTGAAAESIAPLSVKPAFVLPVRGRVISQILAARDVPTRGATTLYAATTAGRVYAVSPTGYVRWRVDLGQLANRCPQLDGYGVGGTPVIDPGTKTLYVADALGNLHALDLATGTERSGWPVALYGDPAREYVWGALALAGGSVYAATGSYCDQGPFEGKAIRVELATRRVTTWVAVPAALGGGGGIWGWGGIASSPASGQLFVATGNAFEGGTNVGSRFSEAAGFGESLVVLSPSLEVIGASHPPSINLPLDLDFVGSPVVFDRAGCGELVVAHDKNAELFGWRTRAVAGGPLWTIPLETFDPANPVLSQLAYDPRRSALFAVTGSQLVRIDIGSDCSARIAWARSLGTKSLNGSPTVAGAVWFTLSGSPSLVAYDPDTGMKLASVPLPGLTVTAPTVVDGRIFVGTFTGQLLGFASSTAKPARPAGSFGDVPGHTSRLDARHVWISRDTGVFSTDDGGRHWQRIFPQPAAAVVRTSVSVGLIRVAAVAPGCTCARMFWTKDGGRHWTETRAIGGGVVGRDSALYWVARNRTQVQEVSPWPPAGPVRSRPTLTLDDGRILDLALVPGGVAALVENPETGAASVLVVRGGDTEAVRLPAPPGQMISASLTTSGSKVTVQATVFSDGDTQNLSWTTTDDAGWKPAPA
ncbi:MAG TPA: PQQ-binding-like beta-propeller repeat protein [Gaiellaceae bacterium]|nr:PQQ-binding-like beta-propeller repeat protein [Gaiellaceae bacterium]